MILLNNSPVVNSRQFIEHFELKGRNTDLVRMANGQLFKYIDGVGEGGFLLQANNLPANRFISMTVSGFLEDASPIGIPSEASDSEEESSEFTTYTLLIKDTFVFNYDSSIPVVFIHTLELKALLLDIIVPRNYNVIDTRYIEDDNVYIVAPDRMPKTIDNIVGELYPTADLIIDSPHTPVPYNFFVQGLNLVEALDLYCNAYGLVWTVYYQNETLKIHIFALSTLQPNPSLISDMNLKHLTQDTFQLTTVHPVIDCCLKSPQTNQSQTALSFGLKTKKIYCPFYPAIADSETTEPESDDTENAPIPEFHNQADLDECSDFIKDNINNYSRWENNYFVKNYLFPFNPSDPPEHIEVRLYHNGYGYRTSFFSGRFQGIPVTENPIKDRQAKNVIGQLEVTYKNTESEGSSIPASYFLVKPVYGLDGWIDVSKVLKVLNIFNWDFGSEGSTIRIEWDCYRQEWIPIQQEYSCPPDDEFPPVPEPPEPEEKIQLSWNSIPEIDSSSGE